MYRFKIIFFGDEACGKTQLVESIISEGTYQFNPASSSTIGANFECKQCSNDESLVIWDLSGHSRFSMMMPFYYKLAQVAVYCVDLSAPINTIQIEEQLKKFQATNKINAPVLLVGTKSDCSPENRCLFDTINTEGVVIKCAPTSAKSGEGIKEFYEALLQTIAHKVNKSTVQTSNKPILDGYSIFGSKAATSSEALTSNVETPISTTLIS